MIKAQLEKENTALRNYVTDLEARHNDAIDALASLAQGDRGLELKGQNGINQCKNWQQPD